MAHPALRRASLVFFFAYVATLVVAGAWGAVGARVDIEIYGVRHYNRLFLFAMACGIGARLLGLAVDGRPSPSMYVFLGFELVAIVSIVLATWRAVAVHVPAAPPAPVP